jgi:hypothetical protein
MLGKHARHAGAALALRLGCRRLGDIGLLPARGRQRGVVRRLGRFARLAFKLRDAAFSAAICASSWSIRASSDATSWASSLRGESISPCGMASVNQLAALGSTHQTRVTSRRRVSSYRARDVNTWLSTFREG